MLTFPVNQGRTLNIVAFHTSPDEWADYPRLTRQGTRDEALRDFAGYGPNVINLLKLTDAELSVVGFYYTLKTVDHILMASSGLSLTLEKTQFLRSTKVESQYPAMLHTLHHPTTVPEQASASKTLPFLLRC